MSWLAKTWPDYIGNSAAGVPRFLTAAGQRNRGEGRIGSFTGSASAGVVSRQLGVDRLGYSGDYKVGPPRRGGHLRAPAERALSPRVNSHR